MARDATHTASLDAELPAHGKWVRELARSLVRDAADADDLAQEVQLAALRCSKNRPGSIRGALAPWLARVTRNLARRGWRDAAVRARSERAAARPEALPGADESAARLEIQRRLVDELSALDPAVRHVLVRRYFDGWTAARIARETGEPASTVRWRQQRGLAELRVRLDGLGGGDGIQWRLALLPLCGTGPWARLTEVLRPLTGAGAIQGVLTMKAASQALGAGALVTAVGLGVWWSAARDEAPRAAAPEGARHAPVELASPPAPAVEVLAPPATPRVALAPESAPATKEAAAEPVPAPASVVSGRCVDEELVPVAGARVSQQGKDEGERARTTTDGTFALDIEPTSWATCTLLVEADGFATRTVELTVPASGTTPLGDVVLRPGGSVRGRVFGPDGAPYAGATVTVTAPDLWGSLEDARVKGPSGEWLSSVSARDGRFEIGGAAEGPLRVWAGAEDMRYAVSPPIEVRARRETDEIELHLEPARTDDRIRGVVLSPAGEPVPGAHLSCAERAGGGLTTFGLATDDAGRFELAAKPGRVYDFDASDTADRWSSVQVKGVRPGTQALALRFQEARWIDVRVRNERGEAHEEFTLSAGSQDGTDEFARAKDERHPGGEARLLVPTEPFVVRVDARGFALAELGPFDPDEAPAELAVELVPQPGVRGRVVAGGEPLAGARVALYEAPPELSINNQGFATLVLPDAADETRTDTEGRFTLKLRKRETFVVRAEADGYAASDAGPFQLAPESGRDELELVLGRGGALEGRVRVAPGRDPSGVIVGLNRGDAFPRTVRTDSEGRFGFEGLTAGEWHLARAKLDFNPLGGGTAFSFAKSPTILPFNCTIREGETTYQDLDLTDSAPCELAGALRVNGAPAGAWGVTAWPGAAEVNVGELPSTATAADGSFALVIDEPGRLRLSFSPPAELGGGGRIDALTDVRAGANEWKADFALGRVSGRCLSAPAEDGLVLFYNTAEGVQQPSSWLPIQPDASGRFVLPFVPAGRGSIRRFEGGGRWTTLVETEVVAGSERVLDVP